MKKWQRGNVYNFKIFRLFSGIGLFRLGLEQVGMTCMGHIEIDKFANKSYEMLHEPKGEFFAEDIRKINAKSLPATDIWCGGFPCQDISVAKGANRTGLSGARSGLFYNFVELLKEAQENKPQWVVLENVKGLFNVGGGWDFADVLHKLAEVGYNLEYALLNSKNFGVAQNRERVYIVGRLGEKRPNIFPLTTVPIPPLSSIIEDKPHKKYFLSKEKTEIILNNLLQDLKKRGIMKKDCNKPIQLVGGSQGNRVYSTNGTSICLSANGGGAGAKTGLYLVFDSDFPRAILTPNRIKVRNNGCRIKRLEDPMYTLMTKDIHGIFQDGKIRRLTPRECFRLQGVPDYYFDKIEGISDTQLYKQAGNAVTVPVVRAIGEKIRAMEESD